MKRWREKGSTLQEIADKLNRKGIKTKKGAIWYTSTVWWVLGNTINEFYYQ